MGAIFAILLILLALSSIILTMWFVLREKREHGIETRYVRSPWNDDPVVVVTDDDTTAEAATEDVTVPEQHGDAHTPLTEHITPADEQPKR